MRMTFSILDVAPTIPHRLTRRESLASCGNAISALYARSAEPVLYDLAGRVRGQFVEELYIPRHLVTGHSLTTPRDEPVGGRWVDPVRLVSSRGGSPQNHERLA